MKVMVTGAGGMLARAMRDALDARGWERIGVFRDEAKAAPHAPAWPQHRLIDLGAEADGATFVATVRVDEPDWIFHFAAWTDVDGCEVDPRRAWVANALACRHAAVAARACGAGLLAISTDYVFGGQGERPWREDDPVAPQSVYARTKLQGEEEIRGGHDRHLIVRTAWLYGAGGRNFVDTIRTRLGTGSPVSVVDDQRGSPTWTRDLVRGMLALIDANAAWGTYHLVNDGDCTWHELAVAIREAIGAVAEVGRTTSAALDRPAPRPAYSVLDCSRFAQVTGRVMPHWRDALGRYVQESVAMSSSKEA